MRRVVAFGLLAILGSCEAPTTNLLVGIDTDLSWGPGAEIESIVLEVRRQDANGPLRDRRSTTLGVGVGQLSPALWILVSANDPADTSPVWLEALGCAGPDGCTRETAVVLQRASLQFALRRSTAVQLMLSRRCFTSGCEPRERCDVTNGRCVSAEVLGEVLQPGDGVPIRFGSGLPRGDGGQVIDASSVPDAAMPGDGALTMDSNTGSDIPVNSDGVVDTATTQDRSAVDVADVASERDDRPSGPCTRATSCGDCTSSGGCGWCGGTNVCAPGTSSGPLDGNCGSGWAFSSVTCLNPVDACEILSGCGACLARVGCGWCGAANRCVTANAESNGPATGTCSAMWAGAASACNVGVDRCPSELNCGGCTATPGCGWCRSTLSCMAGSLTGPAMGRTCTSWAGTRAACANPGDSCNSSGNCATCTLRGNCGWCRDSESCHSGTSGGPTDRACDRNAWGWGSPLSCL
jgi:hypothetical protein